MPTSDDDDPAPNRLALFAWLLYLGGLLVLAAIDHSLRTLGRTDGLGEPLLPILAITLGAAAAVLLWRGAARYPTSARVVVLLLQLGLGVVIHAVATLAYFCGAGIDCP